MNIIHKFKLPDVYKRQTRGSIPGDCLRVTALRLEKQGFGGSLGVCGRGSAFSGALGDDTDALASALLSRRAGCLDRVAGTQG